MVRRGPSNQSAKLCVLFQNVVVVVVYCTLFYIVFFTLRDHINFRITNLAYLGEVINLENILRDKVSNSK